MKYLLVILLLTCACNIQAQVNFITTIAGNGHLGYLGDGGPATSAEFSEIQQVCLYNNNLYVPDAFNNRVRKVNLITNIISTIAGYDSSGYNGDNIPATDARLDIPGGVCADAIGNIYISDQGNGRIRRIDRITGIITTIAGNGFFGYSGDGGQATNAEINVPFGLSIDKYGILYFVDAGNNVIRKIDTNGIISTIAGNGTIGYSGDGGLATDAQLNTPNKAIADTYGNIIIMDGFNHVIRKVDGVSHIISTIAGNGTSGYSGNNSSASGATLSNPSQGYIDLSNNIFFADYYNGVIRRIDGGTGIITTIAGTGIAGYSGDGGPATDAKLFPSDVCLDENGTMYIADYENVRIRMVYNPKLGVNIQSAGNNDVYIFPNPAQNSITVKYDFVKDGEVQITDITGRVVIERVLSRAKQEEEIDVRSLSPGLYLYRVAQNNILTSAGKIIKE